MLKKNDLAKQFDLVIKQEIKNYQDSLNFVLQSINELKESIKDIQQESLGKYASIHSTEVNLRVEIQLLKEAVAAVNQTLIVAGCDQSRLNSRHANLIKDISDELSKKIICENRIQSKLEDVSNQINEIKEKMSLDYSNLNENCDSLLHRFRKEILNTKKEILDKPTEASLVKSCLEEQIASHKVDVAGIMRELTIYKKENFVTQKKIENIYTLIERLKRGEASP